MPPSLPFLNSLPPVSLPIHDCLQNRPTMTRPRSGFGRRTYAERFGPANDLQNLAIYPWTALEEHKAPWSGERGPCAQISSMLPGS